MILLTDTNMAIQYTLVGVCILGAMIWILVKLFRKGRNSGCHGCSLANNCSKADIRREKNKNN